MAGPVRGPSRSDGQDPLAAFSAATRAWFEGSFEAPTAAQAQGWPAIAAGEHTLICAPTGSGKTLAAFLWCLDRLLTGGARRPIPQRASGSSTSRRSRRSSTTSTATCARRWPASPWPPSGWATPTRTVRVGMRTGDTPGR